MGADHMGPPWWTLWSGIQKRPPGRGPFSMPTCMRADVTNSRIRVADPGALDVVGDITWRWRRDLNPRSACTDKRFRGVLLRPLGHATAEKVTRATPGAEISRSAVPIGRMQRGCNVARRSLPRLPAADFLGVVMCDRVH
ncbi:hypothetical protein NOCA280090 [metagenome]|uniref:Uncharacterized protein n=1 Tax=metagenome TaxID=256318 RepID=A0A2P2CF70_9ZZZZ